MAQSEVLLSSKNRIQSIDVARGIIMVIMALDHTRDYFHSDALLFDSTNLEKTNTALFFTRWITHFCAPAFVLLSGASMYISLERRTKKELSLFLLTRGLWLIALEWTVWRFIMFFNFYYDMTILTVLWVIGSGMICMAGIIYLKDVFILVLALVFIIIVSPMNLLIPVLTGRFISASPSFSLIISYPLIPWLSIMMIGYLIGRFYKPDIDDEKRKRMFFNVGAMLIVLFVLIRWTNSFGESSPWSTQTTTWFTVLSFLNVTKYPLSMLFTFMTIGGVLILLSLLDAIDSRSWNPFLIFGRVPLFYFLAHLFLIHIGALLLNKYKSGKSFSEIDFHFSNSFGGITAEGGVSLAGVYLAWITVVIILYPLCRWYNQYKSTHRKWWLSYL
jgi:uncharacterized membrane protein